MNKKILYIIFILIALCFQLKAQETLTGLQVNPRLKKLYKTRSSSKSKQSKAPLELPFFDDFAKSTGYPDSSLWQDNYVFINQNYAYLPLTIGVATFDAIDGTGSIYPNASSSVFGADTLTSKSINLDYPSNNTIFISFFYQPGGLGDTPDTKDSLILEFCHDDTVWNKKWQVLFNEYDSILTEKHFYGDTTTITIKGDTIKDLKLENHPVIIPVDEEKYLNNNFKFRFRNYASLSTATSSESKASNADHWHIDYVLLDKDRNENDTIYEDVSINKPMTSLLKNYDAVPYPHYERASSYEMDDSIQITYRNLSNTPLDPDKYFEIIDLYGLTGPEGFGVGTINLLDYMESQTYQGQINYNFPIRPNEDSALFEIRGYFDNNTSENIRFRWNDTTRFLQKFYNYYAYDDGTAENGYGIIGEGAERAMVAMRFRSYKEDTLRGIQIYFNQVNNDITEQLPFKLHVWKDSNGKPGNIVHTIEGLKPVYEDELNKFTIYELDTSIALKDYFFIGWQKVNTTEMLNVGFDANRVNNDKLYYNISGNWIQSQFEGTVMIRPLFGEKLNISTGGIIPPEKEKLNFKFYPNPARNNLNIEITNDFSEEYRLTIFDIYGRIYYDQLYDQPYIDISNLNPGIFFIRISNSKGTSSTQKFIKVQ